MIRVKFAVQEVPTRTPSFGEGGGYHKIHSNSDSLPRLKWWRRRRICRFSTCAELGDWLQCTSVESGAQYCAYTKAAAATMSMIPRFPGVRIIRACSGVQARCIWVISNGFACYPESGFEGHGGVQEVSYRRRLHCPSRNAQV